MLSSFGLALGSPFTSFFVKFLTVIGLFDCDQIVMIRRVISEDFLFLVPAEVCVDWIRTGTTLCAVGLWMYTYM